MSGGGEFDREGRQVGVLVRASYMYDGKQYVRAVRMTFVVTSINSAYEALSELERAVVSQYLEPIPMSTLTALPIQTPSPSPAPQPNPDGIPGFPVASVLTGLAFMILILWYHSYTN